MLAILTSTILFAILVLLGIVLSFVAPNSYWLIPSFLLILMIVSKTYHQANCRTLEGKDFIWSFLISILFCFMILVWNEEVTYYAFWYYYLCVFLSIVMFADSRRFKSLM